MKRIFLTGATGVIGSAIVPVLLSDPNTELYLLVRADSPQHLLQRMEDLYAFWQIDKDKVAIRRRIFPLSGDTTLHHFGLDEATHLRLQETITCIIHSAADIRMNLSLADARLGSVQSAQEIIDFAFTCKVLNKMEIVSTVGVAGRTQGLILEQPLTDTRSFHTTYEQAKAEAEEMFFSAQKIGLPITVHRPSMVVGNSQTGESLRRQIFHYLCNFLSGQQTWGFLPNLSHVRLDIIPVDYVAKAICLSSDRPESIGRVFHLCGGTRGSLEAAELANKLRQTNLSRLKKIPPLRYLPLPIYQLLLSISSVFAAGKKKRSLQSLKFFLLHVEDSQTFDNRKSDSFFSNIGLPIPRTDTYLPGILRRLVA